MTYDCNFCIFTGWFNPILNCLVKMMHHHNTAWVYVLLGLCFVPITASYRRVHGPILAAASKVWSLATKRSLAHARLLLSGAAVP